jgi:hypothetical protein
MYSLKAILRGLRRPREGIMELNALYYRLTNGGVDYNLDGVDFFAEDWDTLIVLDACRYDSFAERAYLPGTLERRTSRGAGTVEFLRGNFRGRELLDTVYVTANPQFHRHRDDLSTTFHAVEHVWQDEWDDDLGTVHPERMTAAVLEAHRGYPDKRLLVHYNQPHTPFLGPTGQEIEAEKPDEPSTLTEMVHNITNGFVSAERQYRAYVENLDIVLSCVEDLLDHIQGRIVVTADHGEMHGERAAPIPIRYYNHRIEVHVPELLEVPWYVYENGPRPEIREGEAAVETEDVSDSIVAQRLRDLGYVE